MFFIFKLEIKEYLLPAQLGKLKVYAIHAGSKFLGSSEPPATASQAAKATRV
jgi:hypothetical protein